MLNIKIIFCLAFIIQVKKMKTLCSGCRMIHISSYATFDSLKKSYSFLPPQYGMKIIGKGDRKLLPFLKRK